ncbi:MAG: D-alanyl-D-alanine carboxypeptidase [Xanthobacteraceae bacterium]|jgi:D-alanyl-D-alanine carboxypeptidase (penicillin-binding protein 5/6)|nr:D-alanyl-D-alanine carboxypeptidase [Xanthobacteraceae bacterium]
MRSAFASVSRRVGRTGARAVLAALIATGLIIGPAGAQQPKDKPDSGGFQTSAESAILIEAESGSVLYEKNADHQFFPASLSKLMTAEVVFNELREGNVKMDDEFIISEHAWRKGGAPAGGSAMFAAIHSRVKVSDLIQGVIVQSGNDACIAIAEGIAQNEEQFARLMNGRAHEIGMTKSSFTNPTGLHDPGHKTTARDLGILARHIIRTYPEHYHYYGQREFMWNKIRQQNRNPLLAMNIGVDGMKTGFTKESGYGLVASAVQNGMRLIAVVSGLKNAKDRADEGKKLLEWGYRTFESKLIFAEGQNIADAKVFGGAKGSVPLTAKREVRVMVPKNSTEKLIARIVYKGPVPAPVKDGQPVGTLKVWRNDHLALEMPLQAADSVEPGSTPQRAMDAAVELVITLFRAGVQGL